MLCSLETADILGSYREHLALFGTPSISFLTFFCKVPSNFTLSRAPYSGTWQTYLYLSSSPPCGTNFLLCSPLLAHSPLSPSPIPEIKKTNLLWYLVVKHGLLQSLSQGTKWHLIIVFRKPRVQAGKLAARASSCREDLGTPSLGISRFVLESLCHCHSAFWD